MQATIGFPLSSTGANLARRNGKRPSPKPNTSFSPARPASKRSKKLPAKGSPTGIAGRESTVIRKFLDRQQERLREETPDSPSVPGGEPKAALFMYVGALDIGLCNKTMVHVWSQSPMVTILFHQGGEGSGPPMLEFLSSAILVASVSQLLYLPDRTAAEEASLFPNYPGLVTCSLPPEAALGTWTASGDDLKKAFAKQSKSSSVAHFFVKDNCIGVLVSHNTTYEFALGEGGGGGTHTRPSQAVTDFSKAFLSVSAKTFGDDMEKVSGEAANLTYSFFRRGCEMVYEDQEHNRLEIQQDALGPAGLVKRALPAAQTDIVAPRPQQLQSCLLPSEAGGSLDIFFSKQPRRRKSFFLSKPLLLELQKFLKHLNGGGDDLLTVYFCHDEGVPPEEEIFLVSYAGPRHTFIFMVTQAIKGDFE